MSIVAAFIVPDVVTGMVALLIPLILLFEMGLWLARERAREWIARSGIDLLRRMGVVELHASQK